MNVFKGLMDRLDRHRHTIEQYYVEWRPAGPIQRPGRAFRPNVASPVAEEMSKEEIAKRIARFLGEEE